MKLFRERLLARLIERHAISEDSARKLLAWRHPGFSAHLGDAIPFEDKKAIEDVACYIVRNPLSLKKLIYLDGQSPLRQPRTRRAAVRGSRTLIAKFFQTDPLVCKRCGGPLKVVAYLADTVAIRRILDHLGLSPPEEPPPDVREVVRVPVDDQGREIGASPA
jgi:hypothetical protein